MSARSNRVTGLRAVALGAVAAQVGGGRSEVDSPEWQLVQRYHAAARNVGPWPRHLDEATARPDPSDADLVRVGRALGATPLELLAVTLAALVDEDLLVGRLLARLQTPVGGSRPTLGFLAAVLAPAAGDARALDQLAAGAAMRAGLLVTPNEDAPLPERAVQVPGLIARALSGVDGELAGASVGLRPGERVPLALSTSTELLRLAAMLQGGGSPGVLVRTASPGEGRSVAAALASLLTPRLRPAFLEVERAPGLGPWLRLRGLLPVYCVEVAPGERRVIPPVPGYEGPWVALAGPDGAVARGGVSPPDWSVPIPSPSERAVLWRQAIGDTALAEELARAHRHGAGRIAQLGALASRYARAEQGPVRDLDLAAARHRPQPRRYLRRPRGVTPSPTKGDIARAAWTPEGAGLHGMAHPSPAPVGKEALVVSAHVSDELELLVARCRHRDGLVDGLGASASARYAPGVRALFTGPPGTGKTLAVSWLASRLGLPLYRVDLASVTSKYIGETEKNLAQMLARAEQSEVVLLFDEADSLFGRRTDVKDANDRFANAQTNYLLQRIESYDGVVVLTSNSRGRFDPAFLRRLDVVIDFPLPSPEDRRRLWQSHLGGGHSLDAGQVNQLAALADIAGGHIRNAVLTAAVVARAAGRPIAWDDVRRGLEGEFRKLGRQMPVELAARRGGGA